MKRYVSFYYILLIFLSLTSACGRGSETATDQSEKGAISAQIQWDYHEPTQINSSTYSSDLQVAYVPKGVYKLRVTLLDINNNPVSGFQQTKSVTPGESGTIRFNNVPVGTYNVKMEGLDSFNNVLYAGQTNGVGVSAGSVTTTTVIARYTKSDTASPGTYGKSPADGVTDVPANTSITLHVSDSGAGIDATSIVMTVNGTDVSKSLLVGGTSDDYTVIYVPKTNFTAGSIVTVTFGARDLADPSNGMNTETWSFTISTGGTTDTTPPQNPSIVINNGDASTSSRAVNLTLHAEDNIGVTGYYVSESDTTPVASASGWVSITSTTNYSTNVSFTLSSGNGTKTVYVWFKDAVGNVSNRASDSITLSVVDATTPQNPSITINNGASSTTTTAVTLTLSATDNVGVTGYYVSESSIKPSLSDSGWVTVNSATSFSTTASFNLSGGVLGNNTKTVYAWFRDEAGNISESAFDTITLVISDNTKPTNNSTNFINGGAGTTNSTSVILSLSATDDVGVTGYYASESSTTPSPSATGWVSVTSTKNYSANVSFTFSSGAGTKTVYVWFKDAAGNVSEVASDSIIYSEWIITTIDSIGDTGYYTSIAVDSNNKVHCSYYDGTNQDLKYATNSTGIWKTFTIDSDGGVGAFSSIAIDSNNNIHISYQDYTNGNLKYATNNSGLWKTYIIDNTSGGWSTTSIAIDSTNKIHISYYDGNTNDLKYATNESGAWTTYTIDYAGYVGNGNSIDIDSNNKVHITYWDYTNGTLKYTTNISGSWDHTSIDNSSGGYTAIKVDSNNNIHIAYDGFYNNAGLKYATNTSGIWVLSIIDDTNDLRGPKSLAIDSNNKIHISYGDYTNFDLKYATNASGFWTTSIIDGEGSVGWYTSIAIDSNNKVHISYSDYTNNDLKYATNQ